MNEKHIYIRQGKNTMDTRDDDTWVYETPKGRDDVEVDLVKRGVCKQSRAV